MSEYQTIIADGLIVVSNSSGPDGEDIGISALWLKEANFAGKIRLYNGMFGDMASGFVFSVEDGEFKLEQSPGG